MHANYKDKYTFFFDDSFDCTIIFEHIREYFSSLIGAFTLKSKFTKAVRRCTSTYSSNANIRQLHKIVNFMLASSKINVHLIVQSYNTYI